MDFRRKYSKPEWLNLLLLSSCLRNVDNCLVKEFGSHRDSQKIYAHDHWKERSAIFTFIEIKFVMRYIYMVVMHLTNSFSSQLKLTQS